LFDVGGTPAAIRDIDLDNVCFDRRLDFEGNFFERRPYAPCEDAKEQEVGGDVVFGKPADHGKFSGNSPKLGDGAMLGERGREFIGNFLALSFTVEFLVENGTPPQRREARLVLERMRISLSQLI
jgi:hypothetical protein